MNAIDLGRGFDDPVADSQTTFRAVLAAMSEPGREITCKVKIAAGRLPPIMAAVALCLVDFETPLFLASDLAHEEIKAFLTFHTGALLVPAPAAATFALAGSSVNLPPLTAFKAGTPNYPDHSATIIIGVAGFGAGEQVSLTGPGLADARIFSAGGLTRAFWHDAMINASRFPLGLDFIFCGPTSLAALPRSTKISLVNGGA